MGSYNCGDCAKAFTGVRALLAHCKFNGHASNLFPCDPCRRVFRTLLALEMHLNSKRHAILDDTIVNSAIRHACSLCSKTFMTASILAAHSESLAHRVRTLKCPFCSSAFKSPSGVAHHLESGCHHNITRHSVTAVVRGLKIIPSIYAKPLEIEEGVDTTIAIANAASLAIIIPLPSSAFNGIDYQCHLCSKAFGSHEALAKHLNSAAHDDNEFKCPKCVKEFKVVSALIQHLESGVCGLADLSEIEGYFNDLGGQFSKFIEL